MWRRVKHIMTNKTTLYLHFSIFRVENESQQNLKATLTKWQTETLLLESLAASTPSIRPSFIQHRTSSFPPSLWQTFCLHSLSGDNMQLCQRSSAHSGMMGKTVSDLGHSKNWADRPDCSEENHISPCLSPQQPWNECESAESTVCVDGTFQGVETV